MRKRRIPEQYVIFVENMLMHWRTKLKFDNFMSEGFQSDNRIGQGDPMSMILCLLYNVDMLNIAKGNNKKGLGYWDDNALV
jgi:hypothetical protein